MAARENRCVGGSAIKGGQRSGGMQALLSFASTTDRKELKRERKENEEREVAKEMALSSKSSCDCRRNAVTAEGEGVKTNWIFASVTSFFADNSDVFSPCGRSLKPVRRRSWRRLYNRLGSIAVLS